MTILVPDKAEILELLGTTGVFRGHFVHTGALPPPAMLLRALAPAASPWLAPRLFYSEDARQIVGSGAFKTVPQDRRIEIGYGIAPPCRRHGYASAGVRLLVAEAFASGAVEHVFAEVSLANHASQRLLAKLGFATTERTFTEEGLIDIWVAPPTSAATPPPNSKTGQS